MRPPILFPIFSPVGNIKGVGPKLSESLKKLCGPYLVDLIWHFPVSLIDRKSMPSIQEMQPGQTVTACVEIQQHLPPPPHKKNIPYRVRCHHDSGFLTLVFFHVKGNYLKRQIPEGSQRVVSGRVERFNAEVQITHPDYIEPIEKLEQVRKVEPIYPLTHTVSRKLMQKVMIAAVKNAPVLPEWIEPRFFEKQRWSTWQKAIQQVHSPQSMDDLSPHHPARRRLAFDELLAFQLSLRMIRNRTHKEKGYSITPSKTLKYKLLKSLPFQLTNAQKEALLEIEKDQQTPERMMRLLQGDVGSGKTIVAFIAMLNAVESSMQAAIMAPTEILARQHYKAIKPFADELGLNIAFLAGSVKGKERASVLESLTTGELHMIVGTHALFQEQVIFHQLGLVVIDEQHRFGVNQRMSLSSKGQHPDMLLMSATPIPRTLTLTLYGDMECSLIKEKPAGRKPIDTRIISKSRLTDVVDGLKRVLKEGNKAYWICPLVEESESIDLTAVEERFADLKKIFGHTVGLVHGQMSTDEREKTMTKFRDGDVHILVATTVIEVGVDVPDATVIIIEHAERFGLSQLHQLRGRVGRNDKPSSCLLMYHTLGEIAKERLQIMRKSNDGFFIAEEDLRLRGGGEVLGTKQSGFMDFRIANPYEHHDLLLAAADDAKLILHNDPKLESERGKALKILLYLFEYDRQIQYAKAG